MTDETDRTGEAAAERERRMEEHEREAREREPDERAGGKRDPDAGEPAPPGNVEQPRG
jgi:hypothetical protein